ncbi:MAG TPA: LytTR family DNA-binding domain-containing protein [Xanthomonadaceae bacterium]|nr:LytTR family DNA-binding domain-containing protein [Xanthomonadaceae bacterium]
MTETVRDTIRTLIVDDEPLARRGLELRLREHPDVEVVGQCRDGAAAVRAVAQLTPDLMLLDVQMPGLDGFATLRSIPATNMPLIVFVTAYDHYAVRAFEHCAVDYLLKPVEESRLAQALFRVREQLREREAGDHCARLLNLLGEVTGHPDLTLDQAIDADSAAQLVRGEDRLAIRDGSRTVRVNMADIQWVDAAGDYMCVHTPGETHIMRATMRELESQLDPRRFARIHRSTIVNLEQVRSMRSHINGEYFLTLEDGHELKLSRSYRDKIKLLR